MTSFVAISVISCILDGLGIALIIPVLQGIISDKVAMEGASRLVRLVSAPFAGIPQVPRLQILLAVILSLLILKNIFLWLAAHLSRSLSYKIRRKIAVDIFQQIMDVEFGYISNKKSGEIYSWFEFESARVGFVTYMVMQLFSLGIVAAFYILTIFLLSPKITLVVVLPLFLFTLVSNRFNKLIKSMGVSLSEAGKNIFSFWIEIISGLRTIRLFRNYKYEEERHIQYWDRFNKIAMKKYLLLDMLKPGLESLMVLLLIIPFIIASPFIVRNAKGLLPLVIVFVYILKLLQIQINNFYTLSANLMAELPGVEVIEQLLRKDDKPYLKSGVGLLKEIKQGLVLRNVSFKYAGSKAWALHNVSFEVPSGKMVAFVGGSGAGKSTLVDLIFRLYDPQEGEILVDGQSITSLDLANWQSRISYVNQDVFLFNSTVAKNIGYGKLDSSMQDIIDAAKKANAHEFINALPQGYETILGDKGFKLSGGQRQRLAIARAVLKNPQILILDEATSALDAESEQSVRSAISQVSRNRTVVAIAHRLSTVEHADLVVVIENGAVVESGTHHDLLKKSGRYAKLHYLQYKAAYNNSQDNKV